MRKAWELTEKVPLSKSDIEWRNAEILLPVRKTLVEEELIANLEKSAPSNRLAHDDMFSKCISSKTVLIDLRKILQIKI